MGDSDSEHIDSHSQRCMLIFVDSITLPTSWKCGFAATELSCASDVSTCKTTTVHTLTVHKNVERNERKPITMLTHCSLDILILSLYNLKLSLYNLDMSLYILILSLCNLNLRLYNLNLSLCILILSLYNFILSQKIIKLTRTSFGLILKVRRAVEGFGFTRANSEEDSCTESGA